ncbi:MAG: PEGA domain-containing protein [Patescibacteria group bacterium]|jgi:hypothetical protein
MLSQNWRRVIFLIFLVLFLVTAPALVLYTAGYRYNFKKNSMERVGAISVQARPASAEIYLDGQLQTGSRQNNTLRINNLLPGRYQLAIKEAGYHPWQKNLEVSSSANTFVNQAVLFLESAPVNLSAAPISQILKSPDGKNIAALTNNQLEIFNLTNEQSAKLAPAGNNWQLVSWSPESNYLLVKNTAGQFVLYQPATPAWQLPLKSILPLNWDRVAWAETNDYLLYAKAGDGFYQLNLLTKESQLLYRLPAQAGLPATAGKLGPDFFYRQKQLYYTELAADGWWLKKINLNAEQTTPEQILKLGSNSSLFFYPHPENNTIVLLDQNRNQLYLVDQSFSQNLLTANAKQFSWSADGQKLLYYNDWEVGQYNLATKNNELITRYGQVIAAAEFLPNLDYLCLLIDNSLKIIELDNRGERNVIELINADKISNLVIEPKGQNIFFTGQLGEKTGLFKVNIQK